jgi:hypothetical protein
VSTLSLVLFVHVTSAIAVFVALALEGVILQQLRSADEREPMLRALRAFARLRVIYIPAFLGILIGGGYLASRYGRGTGWIPLSLAATLSLLIIGGVVTGRRVQRVRRALAIGGDAPALGPIRDQATSAALLRVYGLRVGLTLGIVFLMTVQPEFVPSLIALVSSAAIGVLATIPAAARGRRLAPPDVRTA